MWWHCIKKAGPVSGKMNKNMFEKNEFDPKELQEIKQAPERPPTLYRGYTVNPETFTLEQLHQVLRPGKHAADDPTRIGDGNELGVYMSTNSLMVEKVYASGGQVDGCFVQTERHIDSAGSHSMGVSLPVCGIVIEVDTTNLAIREPKMIPALQGHYNNGYQGYEWIADEIQPSNYRVIKLVYARHPNDSQRVVVDVASMDEAELQKVIEAMQERFGKAKREALAFKQFLETLMPQQRMNGYTLKKLWEKHLVEMAI